MANDSVIVHDHITPNSARELAEDLIRAAVQAETTPV